MSLTNLKKGDTVILHMFTGIAVGVKEVLAADKTTVTLETRIGKAKFSKKTGKQVEPKAKQERFANYITEDDGSYQPSGAQTPSKKKAKKSEDAKATKKTKAKVEEAEEEEDEEEPEEAPKKAKKKPAAKPAKKSKKKPEPEEDEDFDEDEYEEE